ncbi:2'-5' RNA ligase family protein [Kineococcus sp. SYSU DK003]|uniref:2'-5' RNA ligase family protein n=1 Tax=Kineococcus sp. SYSU DK003 TaxID=3383124 RepID=UPI003D7CDE3B
MQTALVVEVPAADPVAGPWRARFDRAAAAGVPAHVTVCFPFLPPAEVDEDALARLAAGTEPFVVTLGRTGTFGDAVLWLDPEPAGPFRELTRAVTAAFGVLPYGGAHGDPVPHLTVAEDPDDLAAVRADVERRLPLTQRVEALTLLQGEFVPAGWRVRRRFPLGQGSGAGAAGPV